MSYDVGDVWTPELTVKTPAGVLTAATVSLSVTSPAGVTSTPPVTTPSLGVYTTTVALSEIGQWTATWTVSGAVTGVERQRTTVLDPSLVTLAEAKAYMDVKTATHDAEISRYIAQAAGVVQNHAGPAIKRDTFVERHTGRAVLLLDRYPIVSVTSVGSVTGGVSTLYTGPGTDFAVIDGNVGSIASPFHSGVVEVTYIAGPRVPPAEAVDAALLFISYKYRRNHGGSDTYMPAGVDGGIAPPMGVTALEQQIRLALGAYARGPSVA